MGKNNPGRFRREGREAFIPGEDPTRWNPYMRSSAFGAEMRRNEWASGWEQARQEYEERQKELAEAVDPDTDLDERAVAAAMFQVEHYGVRENDLRFAIAAYLNHVKGV